LEIKEALARQELEKTELIDEDEILYKADSLTNTLIDHLKDYKIDSRDIFTITSSDKFTRRKENKGLIN
jgi:hypothetical protein